MSEEVRQHLTVIVAVTIIGIATCAFALMQVHGMGLEPRALSTAVFIIPCAVMLLGSFIITATAETIGRQLYVVVVMICLATGLVATFMTSGWFAGTDVIPAPQNIVELIRNVAAYFVVPTVGCIAGAWIGSRIHPMKAKRTGRRKKK